jgi:predicted O-methyltransferase YrrM
MTLFLKKRAKTELVGVEIGVASGRNALSLLEELPIKKLWLVDPYTPYFEHGKVVNYSKTKEEAKRTLSKFSQVVFVEKTSEEAVKDIDGNLDFVYIDGNHDYLFVKKDIELYYSLLKIGGVIGGHDYDCVGVIRAVTEFVKKHNFKMGIDFFIALRDWWIIRTNGFRLVT